MDQPLPPSKSSGGAVEAFRLPLQPSRFLSFSLCSLHLLLATCALWFFPLINKWLFGFIILVLLLSCATWLLKHWSMSAFQLCCSPRERGGLEFTLQAVEEELLKAPGLELEWQHYEMMIWRAKLSSRGLSELLLEQAGSTKVNQCYGRLLALLPGHRVEWRLLLLRRCHDANKWRLLCQRINYQ